jgi:hypothetical protein
MVVVAFHHIAVVVPYLTVVVVAEVTAAEAGPNAKLRQVNTETQRTSASLCLCVFVFKFFVFPKNQKADNLRPGD